MEASSNQEKLQGFEFWEKSLNGAKLVVAPMVDQSELAWRLLSRQHGAELCFTPMYHASVFVRDANYRKDALASCPEDRPLIIQFCANDPATLLKAAKYAEDCCEAVDLNLGCPQAIAKRGHYGAFLQDDWELLDKMVSLCARELKVPITCKIRIFDDISKTVRYAQMLEKAGCQLLTVHGRTKEQKGANTGIADWTYIEAIKDAVKIPVFANGNIQYLEDVHRCLEMTGVEGVMSAEGNLHNPAMFAAGEHNVFDMAKQYMALVEQYPCPMSYIRGHLFKLLHHTLLVHTDEREILGNCKTIPEIPGFIKHLKLLCKPDLELYEADPENYRETHQGRSPFPYWICQPYVRPNPNEPKEMRKDKPAVKRLLVEVCLSPEEKPLSRRKMKKLRRNPNRNFQEKADKFVKCEKCGNPKGLKCVFQLCKGCCKKNVHENMLDCPGHKLMAPKKPETRQNLNQAQSEADVDPDDSNSNLMENGSDVTQDNDLVSAPGQSCESNERIKQESIMMDNARHNTENTSNLDSLNLNNTASSSADAR